MNNTFYKGYYEDRYIAHYGVLGMKWGIRRYQNPDGSLTALGKARAKRDATEANKWATSEHQPSSIRSSIAAGIYAANPSNKSASRLDKFNERDSARYKAARNEYKKLSKSQREENASRIENRNSRNAKIVSTVAGTLAAKSLIDTFSNWQAANTLVNGYARIPVSKLVTSGAVQAGKVAAVSAIGTYGALALASKHKKSKEIRKDYMDEFNKITDKRDERIKKIEESYKRGQNLSKKDAELESKIEDQYSKEYNELREKYKKRKREGF